MASRYTVTKMGIQKEPTDIDRRGAQRMVPMKVLALGLGRTGTSSLRAALIRLGYVDTYHMISMMAENPLDWVMWRDAFERKYEGKGPTFGSKEWDALLGHCQAVSDFPAICFSDELIDSYPDAKVILTVRDTPEAWHKSASDTIFTGRTMMGPATSFAQSILQKLVAPPQRGALEKMYTYSLLNEDFPTKGIQSYNEHNEHIRQIAPKGQFLEFNVKEGWEPLCKFLGVPVPDEPFPHVNETKTWQETIDNMKKQKIKSLLLQASVGLSCMGAAMAGVWVALQKQ